MPSFWRSKPPAGTRLQREHPLARDLILFVPFNEGAGRPQDLISGITGETTIASGTGMSWVPSPQGMAVKHDNSATGFTDSGSLTYPNACAPRGQAFTFWVRYYRAGLGANDCRIRTEHPANGGFQFGVDTSNALQLVRAEEAGFASSASTVPVGWVDIAVAHATDNTYRYYLNGQDIGGGTSSGTFNVTKRINIGGSSTAAFAPNGSVTSQVLIWNRTLSAGEIASLTPDAHGLFEEPAWRRLLIPPPKAATTTVVVRGRAQAAATAASASMGAATLHGRGRSAAVALSAATNTAGLHGRGRGAATTSAGVAATTTVGARGRGRGAALAVRAAAATTGAWGTVRALAAAVKAGAVAGTERSQGRIAGAAVKAATTSVALRAQGRGQSVTAAATAATTTVTIGAHGRSAAAAAHAATGAVTTRARGMLGALSVVTRAAAAALLRGRGRSEVATVAALTRTSTVSIRAHARGRASTEPLPEPPFSGYAVIAGHDGRGTVPELVGAAILSTGANGHAAADGPGAYGRILEVAGFGAVSGPSSVPYVSQPESQGEVD